MSTPRSNSADCYKLRCELGTSSTISLPDFPGSPKPRDQFVALGDEVLMDQRHPSAAAPGAAGYGEAWSACCDAEGASDCGTGGTGADAVLGFGPWDVTQQPSAGCGCG